MVRFNGSCCWMPFGNFMTDHNMTLSHVASLFRMNLRSRYTDAILVDSDVSTMGMAMGTWPGYENDRNNQ